MNLHSVNLGYLLAVGVKSKLYKLSEPHVLIYEILLSSQDEEKIVERDAKNCLDNKTATSGL